MVALPDFLLVGAPKAGAGGRLPARLRAREVPDRPRLGPGPGSPIRAKAFQGWEGAEPLPGVCGRAPCRGCAAEPTAGGVGAEPLPGWRGGPP